MDSVGLHLVEWPFYPLYVFSYSVIRPVCQQEKLYRVVFFSTRPASLIKVASCSRPKLSMTPCFRAPSILAEALYFNGLRQIQGYPNSGYPFLTTSKLMALNSENPNLGFLIFSITYELLIFFD